MQLSTVPCMFTTKLSSLLQAVAHRKYLVQNLSISHTSFKLHHLLKSVFKQKAHLARFSATAPFQAELKD